MIIERTGGLAPPLGSCRTAEPNGLSRRDGTVSVVVCTYSEARWRDLCDTLRSICRQSYRPLEVVLVVDHCPSLALRAGRAFGERDAPRIVVIENSLPRGLSNARNCGWQVAQGSIVAFIDDDAVAEPTWLEYLVAHYSDEGTAGVGGMVEPGWRSGRPRWFPAEYDWVVGCSHSGMPRATAHVRNFVGANMSFRRAVLERVSGFCPELGRVGRNTSGCEETELCIRAAADGSTLVYVPEARVRHSVPSDRATWAYFIRRCYSEGRSKAAVVAIAGASAALTDERRYLRTTVVRAVVANLIGGDHPGSAGRVVALLAGVVVTALGYLTATIGRLVLGARRPNGSRAITTT